MSCSVCATGLPTGVDRCPVCGDSSPGLSPAAGGGAGRPAPAAAVTQPVDRTAAFTTPPAGATVRPAAVPAVDPDPIVGFLACYSDVAERAPGDGDPRLGRVYALRESDVFFVGKPPLPDEVGIEAGESRPPTGHHVYPPTPDYAHISRRHLVVRMLRDGTVRIIDHSTNGLYFVEANRHVRREKGAGPEVHTLKAPETIVLGLDQASFGEPRWQEKAARFQIEIVPVPAGGPK
jgi:hypothetical protein